MNYIAITGALHMMGQTPDRPQFPSNLVGDFGGGSTYLVIGILAALLESKISGQGQVVDAAIVDGTAHLNAMTAAFAASGGYKEERGANLLDGGVPYYDIYETSDAKHMSVGALEPQFFDALVTLLGVKDTCPGQGDLDRYDEMRAVFTETFKQRTQARVDRAVRGNRRLRGRHRPVQRGGPPPAPRRPRHVRRARGPGAAGAGAAVLAHRVEPRPAAVRGGRPAHPRRARPPGGSRTSTG